MLYSEEKLLIAEKPLSPMALVHGKMLLMKLTLVLLAAATTLLAAAAHKPLPPPQAKPNCPGRCGNITIPYPFGIGDGCYILLKGQEKQFELTCDNSTISPSLNFKDDKSLRVTDFFLAEGELEAMNFISKDCYNESGYNVENIIPMLRWDPPFSISSSKNRFVAVGCDTSAAFLGFRGEEEFMTGCASVCLNSSSLDRNSCSGAGCCHTEIPRGLKNRTVTLESYYNHTYIWKFNPCSYAFLVRNGYFNFSGTRSFEELKNKEKMPMIVDWQIGNETCEVAEKNAVDYACKENSTCANQTKGPYHGYLCRCLPGYEGNPYIGCRDIDECLEINRCGNGTCQNSPASYFCKCNKGFKNDGPSKCIAHPTANVTPLKISLGICIGFFVLLVVIFGLYREYKRRQFRKMKKKYFEANGGPKLQLQLKQLASQKEYLTAQIFTAEELKKATKDYDENEKIGEGGYGTVYKGVLEDKRVVAIKKSKMTAQVRSDQFINEIIVLSQISHKNVVRLLGCCLETKTPLLVYEYVSNGTLYDHIHKKNGEPLSFAQRLKIATETARALSYLHLSAIHRIIHRDVKATNILLDEKLTAKVTDFGASKLVPDDKTILSTIVQGTVGYLDPEYLRSNTLTEKSDVYSFGVVLVELLTGENAVRSDKPEAERNLANVFVSTIKNGPVHPILDGEIVKDGNLEIIERVAKLAEECLSVKGDERPPMEVVERKLDEILKTLEKQPREKKLRASSSKETDHSLESLSNTCIVEVSGEDDGGSTGIISSAEYDASMQNQAQKPFHDGR